MIPATNSKTPKGISVSRNNEGAKVISHHATGMLSVKIFALVWCSIWLGSTGLLMIKMWNKLEGADDFISTPIGLATGLTIVAAVFLIGAIAAANFLSLIYKRTQITLNQSTLSIERRVGPFAKSHQYEKSRIDKFTMVRDSKKSDVKFPSFAVEAQLDGKTASLFMRQPPDVADWFCTTLNQWLNKSESSIFAAHDSRTR